MNAGRERPGVPAALRKRRRRIVVPALVGMALGFLWGIADQPRYSATASVVVEPPRGGEVDPAGLERLSVLGSSEEVATVAAGVLGGDVAGADLLSDVAVAPGSAAGTLTITATSELPDFAAAAADGFAEALVTVAADRANASFRRASERLEEMLAGLDPDSPEAAGVSDRIADLETARASDPVTPGAVAAIPDDPSENRPAARTAAIGLMVGTLAGLAAALLVLRGRPIRDDDLAPAPGEEEEEAGELSLSAALGARSLGSVAEPQSSWALDEDGTVSVSPAASAAFDRIAAAAGLDGEDAPRTLAVVGIEAPAEAHAVAAGIAAAVAERDLRVLLVDADLASPALAERLRVDPTPGLRDYLAGTAGPREVLRALHAGVEGGALHSLACVPAGEPGADAGGGIAGSRFEGLVERLPRVYDVVVIAGPALLDGTDVAALIELTDSTVLVTPSDVVTAATADEVARRLDGVRMAGLITTAPAAL